MTDYLRPRVLATLDSTEHTVRGERVRLDAGAVPYATADLVLPFVDDDVLDWLDPRNGVRIPFQCGDAVSPALRPFDLGLRERSVDHRAKTVTLTLASDEALLQDHAPLEDDWTPYSLASSLRAVVSHVLDTVTPGATLESGPDADVTPVWDMVNLPGNPSFEGGSTAGYRPGGTASGFVVTTAAGYQVSGSYALRFTAGAGVANLIVGGTDQTFRASPGRTYTFSIYVRSISASRPATAIIRFISDDGNVLESVTGITTATSTAGFTRYTVTAQAPAGTAYISPYLGTAENASGNLHVVDAVMLHEGEFLVPFWDGSTPDTASYDYSWAGGVSSSQSIRRALVDGADPEALVWRAGTKAWDFLQTLTARAGMVLWCDELRVWRLLPPADRTIAEQVNISGATAREGTDTLSRDDTDTYVTGVAAVFEWTDADGIRHRRVDSAGTPEKVLEVTFDQAYPGPGMAAQILARRQGTGRRQDVSAIARWFTTPGWSAQIELPGAPQTLGRVTAVEFDLASGFMDLGTAGLVDVTPGDWLALDADLDWEDIPDSTDWEDM